MQARTLVIDAQRMNCDPSLIFQKEWERAQYRFLDETALRIADFVKATRGDSKPIFAIQREELTKTFRRALLPEEASLHRVEHFETEPVLPKTQWSVVREHPDFFEDEKRAGTDTYILAGFWADKCVPENAEHLLELGHRVIVPVDLTCGMDTLFTPEAYVDLAYHKNFVLSDSKLVANMLRLPVEQRTMPEARFTALDIFNLSYGCGG